MSTELLIIAFALLVLGFGLGFLWQKLRMGLDFVPRSSVDKDYVSVAAFRQLEEQRDFLQDQLQDRIETQQSLAAQLAAEQSRLQSIEERLQEQIAANGQQLALHQQAFENMANRLLEEKSRVFADQNRNQLHDLLSPLHAQIKTFEDNIQRRHLEETRDRVSLKTEIEQLRHLNQQLSQDANNLTTALLGDNKAQGDWGELQLARLLESAGLQKGVHFRLQASYRDDEGQLKRPDCIIDLPENKHLIVDSKVSLTAYQRFTKATTPEARAKALRQHIESLRRHVAELSKKKYHELYDINSPDYLLLFVPVEPAFSLALQEDERLFIDALDQQIVIVTNATLLATMRTVAYIWKQEKQKRSVLEIARQSGLLYDKLVAFVEDLRQVGSRLDAAKAAYDDALFKIKDGKRFGTTLIGRAERLRKLGARNTRLLPGDLLEEEE